MEAYSGVSVRERKSMSVCIRVCMCACMCVCTCFCVCMHVHVCLFLCVHRCICAWMCMHVSTHMRLCLCVCTCASSKPSYHLWTICSYAVSCSSFSCQPAFISPICLLWGQWYPDKVDPASPRKNVVGETTVNLVFVISIIKANPLLFLGLLEFWFGRF